MEVIGFVSFVAYLLQAKKLTWITVIGLVLITKKNISRISKRRPQLFLITSAGLTL